MPSAPSTSTIVARLDAALSSAATLDTGSVRRIRRGLSRELKGAPAATMRAVAFQLTARGGPFDRFVAAELLASHPVAMQSLTVRDVRRLGRGMSSWGDVDVFACILAGQVWRTKRLADTEVERWARSKDRWWRRAAVVSTVPLNSRARGGGGDATRTLRLCALVLDDNDPLVVKALSWALRELAKREPAAVRRFLSHHAARIPALVRREVETKLRTGRKTARRSTADCAPRRGAPI